MAENNFKGTVEALFHGMDAVVSSKTVVGDAKEDNVTEDDVNKILDEAEK